MKFERRKDFGFSLFIFSAVSFFIFIVFFLVEDLGFFSNALLLHIIIIGVVGLLLSMYFGTVYLISGDLLKYRSGVYRGAIKIGSIKSIAVDKLVFEGNKPATAFRGLHLKYDSSYLFVTPFRSRAFYKRADHKKF